MILPTASATMLHQEGGSVGYSSLLQSYNNGRFDSANFLLARKRENAKLYGFGYDSDYDESPELMPTDEWGENDPPSEKERQKRQKRMILARRSENGDLESIPPTESMWYHAYISCPQTNDRRFQQKFRRRFRLPYENFLQFVEDATEGNWFPRWKQSTRAGKDSSPLELLILGAFRYLGRGFTFDDCEESTGISEEVHRVFFYKFIEVGSTILYDKYVHCPTTSAELSSHTAEFEMADMPGAPASSDATSIIHEMCAWRLRRIHKGGKSKPLQSAKNNKITRG